MLLTAQSGRLKRRKKKKYKNSRDNEPKIIHIRILLSVWLLDILSFYLYSHKQRILHLKIARRSHPQLFLSQPLAPRPKI
jgi:hypothetical protein